MEFGTPLEDAMRRDLTINSLFYNVNSGLVEDYTGKGVEDLKIGIIRTPLAPFETFNDDPLRVLRVFRFAARFDFQVDQEVLSAINSQQIRDSLMSKISKERKGVEVIKSLKHPNCIRFCKLLIESSLWTEILQVPESSEELNKQFNTETKKVMFEKGVSILEGALSLDQASISGQILKSGCSGTPEFQDEATRRITICLSAVLLGFQGYGPCSQTAKLKKSSLLDYMLREELKLGKQQTKSVSQTTEGVVNLQKMIKEGILQEKVGLWVREVQGYWPHALSITSQIEEGKFQEGCSSVLKVIQESKLENFYKEKCILKVSYYLPA